MVDSFWVSLGSYLLRKIESGDTQRPEAAEHGEKGQTQIVLRDHQRKVAVTVRITEIINGRVLGFKQTTFRVTSGL